MYSMKIGKVVGNSKGVNEIAIGKEVYRFNLVPTSYESSDVTVLLKNLTDKMTECDTAKREQLIQSGIHYSEMLPAENKPTDAYESLYEEALERNKSKVALHTVILAKRIEAQGIKNPVIVSLARAGIPVGVLLKRYFNGISNIDCPHYAISIIRDKGIDINAMEYIYETECASGKHSVNDICFIDGWTGKGVILSQLKEAVAELKERDSKWDNLRDDLYVLADPANVTEYCGTREDYLIPSTCLNSTVSGLLSRTILNSHIDVNKGDFHGAVYFKKFEEIDKTKEFVDIVEESLKSYKYNIVPDRAVINNENGMTIVNNICKKYDITDYKKVKPGIGETTRVLLRRVPWKVLISNKVDRNDPDIAHIYLLCEEKGIPIEYDNIGNYKVCGIIKELSADA